MSSASVFVVKCIVIFTAVMGEMASAILAAFAATVVVIASPMPFMVIRVGRDPGGWIKVFAAVTRRLRMLTMMRVEVCTP